MTHISTLSNDFLFKVAMIFYIPVIFALKWYISGLTKKEQMKLDSELKPYNALWDQCLSMFSFFGSYYCLTYLFEHGYSCDFIEDETTMLWIDLFCVSKIPELIDTVFIVLRNKPLILLQYYHHLATLILCYFGLSTYPKNIIIAASMNYTVHTIMYGYFSLVSYGFGCIRQYGYLITIMQLSQMVIAIYVLLSEDMNSCLDEKLDLSYMYYYSIIMYGSYVLLFGKLLLSKL